MKPNVSDLSTVQLRHMRNTLKWLAFGFHGGPGSSPFKDQWNAVNEELARRRMRGTL